MKTEELLERLTDRFAEKVAELTKPLTTDHLWTSEEVARYINVENPRQVTERYALLPDFPAPVRLPVMREDGTMSIGKPKWKPDEIIAYADKHQRRKPK